MIQLESWLSVSYSATKTQQRETDSFERFQYYHSYRLLRLGHAIYPQNVLWCSLQLQTLGVTSEFTGRYPSRTN